MARKPLYKLKVANKLKAVQIVARTILPPKSQQSVEFFTKKQLENAITAERFNRIRIIDSLPEGFKSSTQTKEPEKEDVSDEKDEVQVEKSKETEHTEEVTEEYPEETETVEEEASADDTAEDETEENEENADDAVLSDSEIDDMTKKQIRKYIEDKNLDVDVNSGDTAGEHKEALKAYFAAK